MKKRQNILNSLFLFVLSLFLLTTLLYPTHSITAKSNQEKDIQTKQHEHVTYDIEKSIDIQNADIQEREIPSYEEQSTSETTIPTDETFEHKSDDAGTEVTEFDAPCSYLTVTEKGTISEPTSHQCKAETKEKDIVLNDTGQVENMEDGLVVSLGGKDVTISLYTSLEDLKQKKNAIPLSGAGFDMNFIRIVENAVEVEVSGKHGFVEKAAVELIPRQMVRSFSHYTVNDGILIYHVPFDVKKSTKYSEFPLGEAPKHLKEGKQYISYNEENFQEVDEHGKPKNTAPSLGKRSFRAVTINGKLPTYQYFQFLPLRSQTHYTDTQLHSYLKNQGYSSSPLVRSENAFTQSQGKEGVNGLLLFAMGLHESAYGMSKFSKTCNNFFGRGAFDSNPSNACASYGFSTAYDGIMAQAHFLNTVYLDVTWWTYAGAHLGNKESGLNVYYASDPDWGKKIASHAFNIDRFLGNKDFQYYRIGWTKSLTSAYNENGKELYRYEGRGKTGRYPSETIYHQYKKIPVIITGETNTKYKVVLDTPKKQSNSERCQFSKAKSGKYANGFNSGWTTIPASVGSVKYGCEFNGNEEYGFVPKGNIDIINNVSAKNYSINPSQPVRTTPKTTLRSNLEKFSSTQTALQVKGWHIDQNVKGTETRYLFVMDASTHRELARKKVNPITRPDVQRAYASYSSSKTSGFDTTIPISDKMYGKKVYILSRYSSDAKGDQSLSQTSFSSQILTLPSLPSLKKTSSSLQANIEQLSYNLNAKTLTTKGWHIDTKLKGSELHYIFIMDASTHREITRKKVSPVTRSDVQRIYPLYPSASTSGFDVTLTLPPQFKGKKVYVMSRYTSDSNGNISISQKEFTGKILTLP